MFSFILYVIFASLLCYLVYRHSFFSLPDVKKTNILFLFILKILVSFVFYYIYTFHYTNRQEADMYRYFDDSFIIHNALFEEPVDYLRMMTSINDDDSLFQRKYYYRMNNWYESYELFLPNDSRTMIRLNAFFMLFSNKNIFIHKLFFLFLSFVGLLYLCKTFYLWNPKVPTLLFYSVFLFPSTLFWTSSISKEAFLFFCFGGFLYYLTKTKSEFSIRRLIILLLFLLLLLTIKIYVFLAVLPFLIVFILFKHQRSSLSTAILFLVFLIVYVIVIWNFKYVFKDYDFVYAFVRKQKDFIIYSKSINASSLINEKFLEPSILSFMSALPMAYVNTILRPFFWESKNLLMLMAALENILFVLLIIYAVYKKSTNLKPDFYYLFSLFFALFFLAIIGLSTPVLGAIVRYKIVAYPFIFFLIFRKKSTHYLARA